MRSDRHATPLRIGILGHGFIDWAGGLEFLRMLTASLNATDERLELHLLLPVSGPQLTVRKCLRRLKRLAARLLGRPMAKPFAPSMQDVREAFVRVEGAVQLHEIDIGSAALRGAFKRLDLDVVIPAMNALDLPPDMPWVGYLYDFQHHHLPQFFSDAERARRDVQFIDMLDKARVAIVNARAVRTDAQAFRPQMRAQIVAMPINASPPQEWFDGDPDATRVRHGIRGPYFIICNQFWMHKDHRTAFEAFARVAPQYPDLQLVCTGATSDHRNPQYFDDLMAAATQMGIRDRIHVLGLIPKQDQVDLVRAARAVVQPTLCEGGPGGGAAYDAIALGVRALVSDIDVNREIDEPNVTFFRAADPAALADAMLDVLRAPEAPPPTPEALVAAGRERRRRCGQAILSAIALARGGA